jgi:hypothetical protein
MALKYIHLIGLASLVVISLILVIIGGSISAWCVKVGHRFECHSLFHSNENFSCLFKLIPTGVIICLSLSFLMFIILILIHNAKKEYQFVARFINILVLSIAIILIMIVLLQWFHPPSYLSKNIIIATVSDTNGNSSHRQVVFSKISSKDPLYLSALEARQRSIATYRYNLNHGPNLFFASFILLLFTLIVFIIVHRINEFA